MNKILFGTVLSIHAPSRLGNILLEDGGKAIKFHLSDGHSVEVGDTAPYFSYRRKIKVKVGMQLCFKEVDHRDLYKVVGVWGLKNDYEAASKKVVLYRAFKKGAKGIKVFEGSLLQLQKAGIKEETIFFRVQGGKAVRCKDPRPAPVTKPTVGAVEPIAEKPAPPAEVFKVVLCTLDGSGEIAKDGFAGSLTQLMEKYPNGELNPSELVEVEFSVCHDFPSAPFVSCGDPRPKQAVVA